MTRAELVARVKQYLGNRPAPSGDTDWYEDRVKDGYEYLTTYRDKAGRAPIRFPELDGISEVTHTYTADAPWIELPADCRSVHGVYNETDSRYMRKKGMEFFIRKNKSDNGGATHWTPQGRTGAGGTKRPGILVYRNPPTGTVFTIYYYKEAEALATAGSVPAIKNDWHLAIAMAAAAIGAGLWHMDDTAAKMYAAFQAFVDTKVTGDEDTNQGGIQTFRVGPQYYTVRRRGSRGRG